MVCMAMEFLYMLRQEERSSGPGFSWNEASACCAVHDIAHRRRGVVGLRRPPHGHGLHAVPDFAHLRLCPTQGDDGLRAASILQYYCSIHYYYYFYNYYFYYYDYV